MLLTFIAGAFVTGAHGSVAYGSELIKGTISTVGNYPTIQIYKSIEVYRLATNSFQTTQDLQQLRTGDIITAKATLDEQGRIAVIDSITSVGLKRLIGRWKTFDNRFMEFTSFEQLVLRESGNKMTYEYSILPDSKNRWTLFIHTSDNVLVGNLTLSYDENQMMVEIYDQSSNQVLISYNLTRYN